MTIPRASASSQFGLAIRFGHGGRSGILAPGLFLRDEKGRLTTATSYALAAGIVRDAQDCAAAEFRAKHCDRHGHVRAIPSRMLCGAAIAEAKMAGAISISPTKVKISGLAR